MASQQNNKQSVCMSFDVECYYQIVKKDYLGIVARPTEEVLRNTSWILDELRKRRALATFYFLGNVAEAYPELVRTAVSDGHEIGVHGDHHEYITKLDPQQFKMELLSAIAKIKSAGATKVWGHRAPAFSIDESNYWALEVCRELGLEYDSSIMPFKGKRYGVESWPRNPCMTKHGIFEVPLSVIDFFGRKFPCMGGGYVRYFPFAYTQYCAAKLRRNGLTPVCYFHPYEFEESAIVISPEEMVLGNSSNLAKLKWTNYLQSIGRGKTMRKKLLRLLDGYKIQPVNALLVGS